MMATFNNLSCVHWIGTGCLDQGLRLLALFNGGLGCSFVTNTIHDAGLGWATELNTPGAGLLRLGAEAEHSVALGLWALGY